VCSSDLVLNGAKKSDVQIGKGGGSTVTGWALTGITATGAGLVGIAMNNASNITISGATIDRNGSTPYDVNPTGDFGLRASHVDALTLQGSVISNNPITPSPNPGFSGGAKFNTATNLVVQNNDFTGNAGGGQLWVDISSSDFDVRDNTIEEVPTAGTGSLPGDAIRAEVSCGGVNGSFIRRNTLTGGTTAAIDLYDSSGITVQQNTVTAPAAANFGIRMLGNVHNAVPDNACQVGGSFPNENNVAIGNAINVAATAGTKNGVTGSLSSGNAWSDNTYTMRHCDPNPPSTAPWMWWDGASNRSVGYRGWQDFGQDVGGLSTCTSTYPQIDGSGPFDPPWGPVGTVVTIHGSGLAGVTSVKFNTQVASFTPPSDSEINTTVPSAATTGTVCVASPLANSNSCSSASFIVTPVVNLTVTRSGNQAGTVTTVAPYPGIVCGTTCSYNFPQGSSVVLHAEPDGTSTFVGWTGGGCSGTGDCTVAMNVAKSVDAQFALAQRPLTVVTTGNGGGTVRSDTGGIDCPATCAASYDHGTDVELTAAATDGSSFTGWSGDCGGTAAMCTVTMDAAKAVTATFTLDTHALTITKPGSGTGAVMSDVAGIDCGDACSATYDFGTGVALTATPDTDMVFESWSGACAGTAPTCTVTMDAEKDVSATFVPDQEHTLTVTQGGSGSGTITSDMGAIDCGSICSDSYPSGTLVTLTATDDGNSTFSGWSGDTDGGCPGTDPCAVTMSRARSVTATFDPIMWPLSVSKIGTGTGTVTTLTPHPGIDCGSACQADFEQGTSVTLHAVADASTSTFLGWSGGGCSGIADCVVSLIAAKIVSAQFDPAPRLLIVTKAGNGSGSVSSDDAGAINCPTACTASYANGTGVTLTEHLGANSVFTGWSRACTGTGTCDLTMSAAMNVTATFTLVRHPLTVSTAGSGTVTSNVGGISCPGTCSASYDHGTAVTLTASPGANSVFTGWSGDCSGTGTTCGLTMSGAMNVTATFTLVQHPLTVSTGGTGAGTVTSNVGGISCPGTCSASYDHGTAVILTATSGGGSTFAGWSGACTGTGACSVTMSAAMAVTATFNLVGTTTAVRDDDLAVAYNGWLGVADAAANGGSYRMSSVKDDTATWRSPVTTSITWVTRTGPDQGKASVSIDGKSKGTFDLYSGSPATSTKVFSSLGSKTHTIVIKVLHTKNASSSDYKVRLDAFVVGGSTTQESSPSIQYDDWAGTVSSGATDGSYRCASASTATATLSFTGSGIDWITAKGTAYGKATVKIDGVNKGTFDLYRSGTTWRYPISFTGLAPGRHTIVIRALHQKNAAATGTKIVVDGFIVQP